MKRVRALASQAAPVPAAGDNSAPPPPLTAVTPQAPGHESLGPRDSRYVDVASLPWMTNERTGVKVKQLLSDPRTGLATVLNKMPPHVFVQDAHGATKHEHVQMEQTFILEGALIDAGDEERGTPCGAGNYVWRPPGSIHAAHAGPDGVTTLAIFVKPNRFFGEGGSQTDMMGRNFAEAAAKLEGGIGVKQDILTAVTPNAPNHGALGDKASRYVNTEDLPWGKTRFPGCEFKTLMVDPANGMSTSLVRFQPGAVLPDHEHVHVEQTYILQGSLVDSEGAATAGNYVWRPPGSRHAATAGPDGCLCLSIFMKPNRFFEKDGSQADMFGQDYDKTWKGKD